MAVNTRDSMKEAEKRRKMYFQAYLDKFSAFFHNAVKVKTNEFTELPKRYLLTTLLNKGAIAFDKQLKLFLPFTKSGIDIYGLPKQYVLIGMNGFTKTRKAEDVVILRANDESIPLMNYFEIQSEKLTNIDMAINQNLDAVKTMSLIEVPDKATMLSFSNLESARQMGASVVYVNKSANINGASKSFSTNAQYLVDKLLEARREILNETFQTIGIGTINSFKKERIQNSEIEASNFYTIDSLNTLIDTFNYDAEFGGIDIRLEANTIATSIDYINDSIDVEDDSEQIEGEQTNANI